MRLLKLSVLVLAAETAYGYLDTSPFFMFSTSELLSQSSNLQTASSITTSVSKSLSQCPSDFYILVSQPGVTPSDYTSRHNTPTLARHLSSHPSSQNTASYIRSRLIIAEVLGHIDVSRWQSLLASKCSAGVLSLDGTTGQIPTTLGPTPQVLSVSFAPPSPSMRTEDISQNDLYLAGILDVLPSTNYTVLYTTSTSNAVKPVVGKEGEYTMTSTELEQALHMDLKRDLGTHEFSKRENITLPEGALFHRYQFFTPGIFMGLLVGFVLLMILYVGISALASLQVSYAAFDKERGQLAAKKTQ